MCVKETDGDRKGWVWPPAELYPESWNLLLSPTQWLSTHKLSQPINIFNKYPHPPGAIAQKLSNHLQLLHHSIANTMTNGTLP